MPAAFTEVLPPPVPQIPPRKRWTRAECEALAKLGIFDQDRVELVEGELISKMGKRRPHANALARAIHWTVEGFGWRFVQQQVPIDVAPRDNPTNEPEPDLIVLQREFTEFPLANPGPEDLILVFEISDSEFVYDLTTKASLYARAEISEYWVLDCTGRRLILHREPKSGAYASIVVYKEHESVAPLAAPHAQFRVADAFPE